MDPISTFIKNKYTVPPLSLGQQAAVTEIHECTDECIPALQICAPQPNIRCREGWGEEARGSGGNLGLIAWMRAEAVCINKIMCDTSSSILCWQTTQWPQYQHNKGWGSRVGTRLLKYLLYIETAGEVEPGQCMLGCQGSVMNWTGWTPVASGH